MPRERLHCWRPAQGRPPLRAKRRTKPVRSCASCAPPSGGSPGGDAADAVEQAAQAVALAARHGDPRLAARATTLLGEAAWADGDVGAATDHAEQAVKRWRGLEDATSARALPPQPLPQPRVGRRQPPNLRDLSASPTKSLNLLRERADRAGTAQLDAEREAISARSAPAMP